MSRWWSDPESARTMMGELADSPVRSGAAFLGLHSAGRSALIAASDAPGVGQEEVEAALNGIDDGFVRDVWGDGYDEVRAAADAGAKRMVGVMTSSGVPWPVAVERAAAAYGIDESDAVEYARRVSAPVVNPKVLADEADVAVLAAAASAPPISEDVSKGSDRNWVTVEVGGRRVRRRVNRDEDGQFAPMNRSASAESEDDKQKRRETLSEVRRTEADKLADARSKLQERKKTRRKNRLAANARDQKRQTEQSEKLKQLSAAAQARTRSEAAQALQRGRAEIDALKAPKVDQKRLRSAASANRKKLMSSKRAALRKSALMRLRAKFGSVEAAASSTIDPKDWVHDEQLKEAFKFNWPLGSSLAMDPAVLVNDRKEVGPGEVAYAVSVPPGQKAWPADFDFDADNNQTYHVLATSMHASYDPLMHLIEYSGPGMNPMQNQKDRITPTVTGLAFRDFHEVLKARYESDTGVPSITEISKEQAMTNFLQTKDGDFIFTVPLMNTMFRNKEEYNSDGTAQSPRLPEDELTTEHLSQRKFSLPYIDDKDAVVLNNSWAYTEAGVFGRVSTRVERDYFNKMLRVYRIGPVKEFPPFGKDEEVSQSALTDYTAASISNLTAGLKALFGSSDDWFSRRVRETFDGHLANIDWSDRGAVESFITDDIYEEWEDYLKKSTGNTRNLATAVKAALLVRSVRDVIEEDSNDRGTPGPGFIPPTLQGVVPRVPGVDAQGAWLNMKVPMVKAALAMFYDNRALDFAVTSGGRTVEDLVEYSIYHDDSAPDADDLGFRPKYPDNVQEPLRVADAFELFNWMYFSGRGFRPSVVNGHVVTGLKPTEARILGTGRTSFNTRDDGTLDLGTEDSEAWTALELAAAQGVDSRFQEEIPFEELGP